MTTSLLRRLAMCSLLTLLAVLSGCSDGAAGEKGVVRFSQIVNFVETQDFTPPVVVNRTILIRLERNDAAIIRHQGYPELTLEVTGGTFQLLPLGFGEYAVRLDEEKTYRFHARDGKTELDAINVKSKKASGLRWSDKATVVTSSPDGKCASGTTASLQGLSLSRNQSITLIAVPTDTDGSPMLGLLQLTAHESTGTLALDTPLFSEGLPPNGLTIDPAPGKALGASLTLSVAEENGLKLDLTLPTANADVGVTCTP